MAFSIPNQTSTSLLRPTPTRTPWVRPADWITITDTANEVQFLMSDATTGYVAIYTTYTGTGNIYIDWGDGTTTTISSGAATTSQKQLVSGGTASSLGYNMWKIRVYADAGATITMAKVVGNTQQYLGYQASGLLEAVYGDNTCQSGNWVSAYYAGSFGNPWFPYFEYLKLPATLTTTSLQQPFVQLYSLRKVVMPTSAPNLQNVATLFGSCISLSEPIIMPQDAVNITSLNAAFGFCYALTSITLPPTLSACTNVAGIFQNCYSLTSIQFPPVPQALDYTQAFGGCKNLISFEFKAFPTTIGTINMTSMFNGCTSLEYIKLPPTFPTGSVATLSFTFNGCASLKNIVLPSNLNATTMASCFQGCSSLASIVLPSSIPSLTSMNSMCSSCSNLQSITLPSITGTSIDMGIAFQSCSSLTQVDIPASYTITSLSSTSVSFGNLTQNSLANMASAFSNCSNLKSVVMPTSMNALTTLSAAFSNCYGLTGCTLPSSLNALTTMASAFGNCYQLESITMPTSATSLTTMSATFQSCFNLKTITLPTTTGLITTFTTCFNACYSLRSIDFPNTQLTTLSTISSMGVNTLTLSGITNLDKLGNTSTSSVIYVDGTNAFNQSTIPTLDFYTKFSKLAVNGIAAAPNLLSSIRLRNNGAGQYAGTSPQIDVSYTSLGQAALVQLFNDLPTITAKTINITGASGAASLTAGERAIATGKGWTITG
jgi:hypothetical protein